MKILSDHNIVGQSRMIMRLIQKAGWADLLSIRLVVFHEVGLSERSTDRVVWRFAQAHDMILLTGNRNNRDLDSLALTLREENTPEALPVATIGNLERFQRSSEYRQSCAQRLIEIVVDIEEERGAGRIYIP